MFYSVCFDQTAAELFTPTRQKDEGKTFARFAFRTQDQTLVKQRGGQNLVFDIAEMMKSIKTVTVRRTRALSQPEAKLGKLSSDIYLKMSECQMKFISLENMFTQHFHQVEQQKNNLQKPQMSQQESLDLAC